MVATSFSLEFCFIHLWQLFHRIFHSAWHLFRSNFHCIRVATSFSLRFCLIPLWQLFHGIFHSSWHLFRSNFHCIRVATSFSLRFCLIPLWQLFHGIFHSSWHLFQSNFHFFRVVTSFSLAFRVHPMGHQECGHMTCYLKWEKNENGSPALQLPKSVSIMLWSAPIVEILAKRIFKLPAFCLFFWNFLFENNSKYHNFNKFRKQKEGLQLLYCGKFGQKRKRHTLKGSLILTD